MRSCAPPRTFRKQSTATRTFCWRTPASPTRSISSGTCSHRPPSTVYPRAKAAATRALNRSRAGRGARVTRRLHAFYDRDWAAAEREFQAALSLNPGYASGHQRYGWYLLAMGRFDDMLAAMRRAAELDPLSLIINVHLGYALSLAGHYQEAIAELYHTLELDAAFCARAPASRASYRAGGRQGRGPS